MRSLRDLTREQLAEAQPFLAAAAQAMDVQKAMRRTQFDVLRPNRGGTVFLGDSITEGGLWNEWFPSVAAINRGIGGDVIEGVINRLDSAINAPRAISLLIGTNDLSAFGIDNEPARIAERAAELFERLRAAAPDALILVNAVMPRTPDFAPLIKYLNAEYRAGAKQIGATFVDTWELLADEDGALGSALTMDGLHLTGEGYRLWVQLLRPHIST